MNLAQTLAPLETERETLCCSLGHLYEQQGYQADEEKHSSLLNKHEIQHEHKTKLPFIEKNASETTAISLMF